MIDPIMMFKDGGPFALLLLGMVPFSMLFTLICAGFAGFGFRVPIGVWLAPATAVLTTGLVGTAMGAGQASEAIAYASTEVADTLAAAGYAVASYTTIQACLFASLLLGLTAWLAAIASVVRGGDRRVWTPTHAIPAVLLGGLAAVGAVVAPTYVLGLQLGDAGPVMIFMPLVCIALTPAVALASAHTSRRAEDAARMAELRALTAVAATAAVVLFGIAFAKGGQAAATEAIAHASAEMKMTLWASGYAVKMGALYVAVGSAAPLALGGALGTLFVGGHLFDKRGILNAFSLLLLLPLPLAAGFEHLSTAPLRERVDSRAELLDWSRHTPDLPTGGEMSGPRGDCLVRRASGSWQARARYSEIQKTDCPVVEAPAPMPFTDPGVVVAIQGTSGVGTLANAQWFEQTGSLWVMTESEHDLPPDMIRIFGKQPRAAHLRWDAEGPADGDLSITLGMGGLEYVPDRHGDTASRTFVVADPRLTVQDLVTACEDLRMCWLTPSR